jgi:hypothetical protein
MSTRPSVCLLCHVTPSFRIRAFRSSLRLPGVNVARSSRFCRKSRFSNLASLRGKTEVGHDGEMVAQSFQDHALRLRRRAGDELAR